MGLLTVRVYRTVTCLFFLSVIIGHLGAHAQLLRSRGNSRFRPKEKKEFNDGQYNGNNAGAYTGASGDTNLVGNIGQSGGQYSGQYNAQVGVQAGSYSGSYGGYGANVAANAAANAAQLAQNAALQAQQNAQLYGGFGFGAKAGATAFASASTGANAAATSANNLANAAAAQVQAMMEGQLNPGYVMSSKPVITTFEQHQEGIISQQDDSNLKYDDHIYFKSAFINNLKSFDEYWTDITKSRPLRLPGSRNSRRRDRTINLTFDFPLRGHVFRSIVVANGGFINLSGEGSAATQYIAPLMADFDNRTNTKTDIKMYDDGTKFSAVWENLHLQGDSSKTFTFSITLYKSGEVIFAYKDIPISVQNGGFSIGISDINNENNESYNLEFNYPFSSGTLLKILPSFSQTSPSVSNEKEINEDKITLIKPDVQLANLRYETYDQYKVAFIGNVEFFNEYWTGLYKTRPLRAAWTKSNNWYETKIDLSFKFPFYNRFIESITVTSGGYILLGEDSHYIAPLRADFELPTDINSVVKLFDTGDKFIAVWDSLYLKSDKSKAFTFAVIFFNTGEIVYLYKLIPDSIQTLYNKGYNIQFGFSNGEGETQQVQFKNYDVSSGTLFKILSLQAPKAPITSKPTQNKTPVTSSELISAEENVSDLKYQTYTFYKIALIGNLEYFNDYWLNLFKTKPLLKIWKRNNYRYETTVELSFEFLYFGQPLRHFIVTTGGYITFGEDAASGRALKHYIAPLAADFDDISSSQKTKLYDDGEKFTVLWEEVQLRTDRSKSFTFGVTLYKTGEIVFFYKFLPLSIQSLYELDKGVRVGFADSNNDAETSREVLFNNYDIATATLMKVATLSQTSSAASTDELTSPHLTPITTEPETSIVSAPYINSTPASQSVKSSTLPNKIKSLIRANKNPDDVQYNTYSLYKTVLITNSEYFRNVWQGILTLKTQLQKVNWVKKTNHFEAIIELEFEFPFYGRMIRSITITNAGYIKLGDDEQYIAPLNADFDENMFDPSSIRVFRGDEKYSIVWENLPLRADKTKLFSFALTLHKTGDIEFIYETISVTIQLLYDRDDNVIVGISDLDEDDSEESHKISFNNYDISSNSVIRILSLSPPSVAPTTTSAPTSAQPLKAMSHAVEPLDAISSVAPVTYPTQNIDRLDIPKKLEKLVRAAINEENLKYELYPSYKVGLLSNLEYFNNFWIQILKSQPIQTQWIRKHNRYETVVNLIFEFPYYGRSLQSITITSAGFIILGNEKLGLKQYIAPLMADFDENLLNVNSVKLFQDKDKFSVIWDSLPLKSDKTKLFTFGVTLYKSGDITFTYKYIAVTVQLLYERDSNVKVGISELIDNESDETQEILFLNYDVSSGSIIRIISLTGDSTSPNLVPSSSATTNKDSITTPKTYPIQPLEEPKQKQKLIKGESNPEKLTYETYTLYEAGLITNPRYFNEIWLRISKSKPLKTKWTKKQNHFESIIELSFEFPLYGRVLRSLRVTSAGFIILGDEDLEFKQYIAPLMADFDETLFNPNSVKLYEDSEKFTVIWDNLPLKSDKTKTFTFGLTLYKNGEIEFLYKYMSITIELLYEIDNTANVGISDFVDDESDETQTITFNNFDISSDSILKIKAVAPANDTYEKKPVSNSYPIESPRPEKIQELTTFSPTTERPYSNIHFVMAEEDSQNLKYVTHSFYKSTYVGNKPYYNDYWADVKKSTPHKLVWKKTMHPYETDYELSFEFPFYDYIIRNITITSGGFILLGDHLQPDGAIVKQYIAPLMAEFDDVVFKEESIKFLDDGTKFIVLWENMYLQEDHEKAFTFAAILYKTGDIVFIYEDIPIPIQTFYENQQLVKVGISDDYLSDPSRWLTFMNYDIRSGTVLKLLALFTPKTTPVPSTKTPQTAEIEYDDEPKPTATDIPFTNVPKLSTDNQIRESLKPQLVGTTQQTLLDQNQLSEDIFKESQASVTPIIQTFVPMSNEFIEPSSPNKPNQVLSDLSTTELPPELKFQFQSHYLYKSVMIKNPLYFEDHWTRILKSKPIKYTWHKSPYGYEATLDPSFDLPFYDIILPKITVNSAGFINLIDYLLKDGIDVMQYIAPLKGSFDVTIVDENTLKIYDDGEKLTFLWENLYLKGDKTKTFTFALTLYANGDIVFAYKTIPMSINTSDKLFDIGVSAAYVNENNDYESKREIFFKNYIIDSGTILAIIALPLVDDSNTEPSLTTSDSPFLQTMSPNLASLMNSVETNEPTKVISIPTTAFTNPPTDTLIGSITSETLTTKLPVTTPSSLETESLNSQSPHTTSYPLSSTLTSQSFQPNSNKPSTLIEEPFYINKKTEDLNLPSTVFVSSTTTSQPDFELHNNLPLLELVKPQTNTLNIKYTPHSYYQSALISNVLYFEEYWTEVYQSKPLKKIWKQSPHGFETTVDLTFEFLFYGRVLYNITVTSNGFIDLGDEFQNGVHQYISPLMADFDDTTDKNVKLFEGDDKITVVWEDLQLKTDKSKKFTFSLTLYSNGDIIFGYKDLPISIQNLNKGKYEIKVGLSDSHVTGHDDEQLHLMSFTNYDISSGSILKITTLQTDSLLSTSNHVGKVKPGYSTLTPLSNENKYEVVSSFPELLSTLTPIKAPLDYMDTSIFREKVSLTKDNEDSMQDETLSSIKSIETITQQPISETIKIIEASDDPVNFKYETYDEYKVAFIGDPKYFNDFWSTVTKSRPIRPSGRPGIRRNAKLSFDFPFYEQKIQAISISTEGFIDLNNSDAELPTHYIAPLMAKFDTKTIKPSSIKLYDDGDKCTVVWENLHLEQDSEQIFTFAVTLYKSGEISFAYKTIPSLLQLSNEYKVGISDEANTIKFNNYNIISGTVLKLISKTQNEPTTPVPTDETSTSKIRGSPNRIRGRPISSTTEATNSASEEPTTKPARKLPGRRIPTKTTSNDNDKYENDKEIKVKPISEKTKHTLIKPADSLENIKYETYYLYKVAFIGNTKLFNEHWLGSTKSRPIKQNEGSNTRRIWKLTFDFPFNGHIVRDIIVNGEGYIDLSANSEDNELPNKFIAPLFGKFDINAIKPNSIKLYDDGEKFTAIWENMYFLEDKNKLFTFAVTLYKNGDVVFAYKNIPKPLQPLFDGEQSIKIGFYDALTSDEPFTLFFTNYDITSFNLLKILPEDKSITESSKAPKGRNRSKTLSSTTELPTSTMLPSENTSPSRGRPRISGLRPRIPSTTEASSQSTPVSESLQDEKSNTPSVTQSVPLIGRGRGRPNFNIRQRLTSSTVSPTSDNDQAQENKSELPVSSTTEPPITSSRQLRTFGRRQRPTTSSETPLVEVTSEKLESIKPKTESIVTTTMPYDNEPETVLELTTLKYNNDKPNDFIPELNKITESSTAFYELHEQSTTESESSKLPFKSTTAVDENITTTPLTTTEDQGKSIEVLSQNQKVIDEVVEIQPKLTRQRISSFRPRFSSTTESALLTVFEPNEISSTTETKIPDQSEETSESPSISSLLPKKPGFHTPSRSRGESPITAEVPEDTEDYISRTTTASSTVAPESSSGSNGFRPRISRPRPKTTETTTILSADEKLLQEKELELDHTTQHQYQVTSEIPEPLVNESSRKPSRNRGKFTSTTTEKPQNDGSEPKEHQITTELPEIFSSEQLKRPNFRPLPKNRFSATVKVNPSETTEQTPKLENEIPEVLTKDLPGRPGLRLPARNRFRTTSTTTEKVYPSEVTDNTHEHDHEVTTELNEVSTSEQPSRSNLRLPSKNRFKVISSTTERAQLSEVTEHSPELEHEVTSELSQLLNSEQPSRPSLRLPSKNRFKVSSSTTERTRPSEATEHSPEFEHNMTSELPEVSSSEQPSRTGLRLPSKNRFKVRSSTTERTPPSEATEHSPEFEHNMTSELPEDSSSEQPSRTGLRLPSKNRFKASSSTTERVRPSEAIEHSPEFEHDVTSELPEVSSSEPPSRTGLRLPSKNRFKVSSSTTERIHPSEATEHSPEFEHDVTSELPEVSSSEHPSRTGLHLPSKNRFKVVSSTTERIHLSEATAHSPELEHEVTSELPQVSTNEQPSKNGLHLPSKNRFKVVSSATERAQPSETAEHSPELEHEVTSELPEVTKSEQPSRSGLRLPSKNRFKVTSSTTDKPHSNDNDGDSNTPDQHIGSEKTESPLNEQPNKLGLRLPSRNRVKTLSTTEEPRANSVVQDLPLNSRSRVLSTAQTLSSTELAEKSKENTDGSILPLKRPKINSLKIKIASTTTTTETSEALESSDDSQQNEKIFKHEYHNHNPVSETPQPKNNDSSTPLLPKRPPGRPLASISRGRITTTSTTQAPSTSTTKKSTNSFRNRATGGVVKIAPFRSKGTSPVTPEPEEPSLTEIVSEPNSEPEKLDPETSFDDQEHEIKIEEPDEHNEPLFKSPLQKQPLPGFRAPNKFRGNLAANNKESIGDTSGTENISKNEGSIRTSGNRVKITGVRTRLTGSTETPISEINEFSQVSSLKSNLAESSLSTGTLKRPIGNLRRPGMSQGTLTVTTVTNSNETPDLADLASKVAKDATKLIGSNVRITGVKTKVITTKVTNDAENEEESEQQEHPVGTLQLDEQTERVQGIDFNGSPLSRNGLKITGIRRIVRPDKVTLVTNDNSDDAHEITSEEIDPELHGDITLVSSDNTKGKGDAFKITRARITSQNQQNDFDSSQNNGEVGSSEIIDASKLTNGAYVNKGTRIIGKFKVTGTPIGLQEFQTEGEVPQQFGDMIQSGDFISDKTEGKGTLIGRRIATKNYKITGTATAGSEQEFANLLQTKIIPDLVDTTRKIDGNLDSEVLSDEKLNNQLNARSFVVQAQQPIVTRRRQKITFGR